MLNFFFFVYPKNGGMMKKEGVLASLFWVANIVLVKVFLNSFDASLLALYKALLSSVLLLICLKNKIVLTKKEIIILMLSGLFTVYFNYYFSYLGMKEASLTEVSLFNSLTLVLTRGKLDVFSILIILGFLIGTKLEVNIYLLLSMIMYCIGIFISRKSDMDYIPRTMCSLFFGSLFFLPKFDMIPFSIIQWFLFLFISVLGYGYIMYVYMKTSSDNPYLSLHPLVTYLIGFCCFHEPFSISFWFLFGAVFYEIMIDNKKQI